MVKVVSVDVMRASDAWTIRNKIPSKELMYRAGKGIYEQGKWIEPVAVICGKGNNAGDGFVVANLMKQNNVECCVILLSDTFSEDGKYYYDICRKEHVKCISWEKEMDLSGYGSIVDCIFGTGFHGIPKEPYKEAIEAINRSKAYVVSADINSGLNGDTGFGNYFVKSDLTVSIGNFKTGHFCGLSGIAMKKKVNIDIGIEIKGPYEVINE